MQGGPKKKNLGNGCTAIKPVMPIPTLAQDIYRDFRHPPRQLLPKYLYDEKGSYLFDKICHTEEYYLTRTEEKLLSDNADEIVALAKPRHIIEFGSGMSHKIRILLDACERQGIYSTYWPMDICTGVLEEVSQNLCQRYPWLEIHPLAGDYHAGLSGIQLPPGRTLALLFGSTIGNMALGESLKLLLQMQQLLGSGGNLLLGVDRVKSEDVLEAAYNDTAGITRQFIMNVLRVLNRRLNANFFPDNFLYKAVYNAGKERVEMFLVTKLHHTVHIKDLNMSIRLAKGEHILTEVSQKFTCESLTRLLSASSGKIVRHFVPENAYFSLLLARFCKKTFD